MILGGALALGLGVMSCVPSWAQGMKAPMSSAQGLNGKLQSSALDTNSQGSSLGVQSDSVMKGPFKGTQELPANSQALGRLVPPAGNATQKASDFIVALVDSDPVTNQEVMVQMQQWLAQMASQKTTPPPKSEFVKEVLEKLINERTQLDHAKEQGIRVSKDEVSQAELSMAIRNGLSVDAFRQKIVQTGVSEKQFLQELENELTLQRLREKEVNARIKVSEQEIDQYLKEIKAQDRSNQIELAEILIEVPEGASAEQEKALLDRINALKAQIVAGESFESVAKASSQSSDKAQGGHMGLKPVARYPDLFIRSIENAKVGDLVGPVRSGAGFHLIKFINQSENNMMLSSNQTHVRHILLRASGQNSVNTIRVKMYEIKKRLDSKELDFAQVAKEMSQDGTAERGGDLGWVGPGAFVPEFEEVMNHLKPGEVSDPVVTRFGVHLIEVLERRANTMTPKEQRDWARNALREKKYEQAYADWAQEVRGRAYIEYRDAPDTLVN
jgi:peptidyl-prolyl cis-trans isomerase SurA